MRVYLHLEEQGRSFTLAQKATDDTTLLELLGAFVNAFNAQNPKDELTVSQLSAKDQDGKTIRNSENNLSERLESGSDIFVSVKAKEVLPKPVPAPVKATSVTPVPTATKDVVTPPAPPAAKAPAKTSAKDLARITQFLEKKSFRRARLLGEQLLSVNKTDTDVLQLLAETAFHSKKYAQAITWCRTGIKLAASRLLFHYFQGKSQLALQKHEDAAESFATAQKLKTSPDFAKYRLELVGLRAEAVFLTGKHNEAVDMINAVTHDTGAVDNISVLIVYSLIALKYVKWEEATRTIMKAIVIAKNNEKVGALLAELLSHEAGVEEVMKQIPPVPADQLQKLASGTLSAGAAAQLQRDIKGKVEVYGFLAYNAKCQSQIQSSTRLFQLSLQMQPQSANCALNIVHMYEITGEYDKAIAAAVRFLEANPNLGVAVPSEGTSLSHRVINRKSDAATLRCRDLLAILQENGSSNSEHNATEFALNWIDLGKDLGYLSVYREGSTSGVSRSRAGEAPIVPMPEARIAYTDAELDLVALIATTVKILYLQGKLHLLPAIYLKVEPVRMQSSKHMHETTIRNEMAYFGEIGQLLAVRSNQAVYGLQRFIPRAAKAGTAPGEEDAPHKVRSAPSSPSPASSSSSTAAAGDEVAPDWIPTSLLCDFSSVLVEQEKRRQQQSKQGGAANSSSNGANKSPVKSSAGSSSSSSSSSGSASSSSSSGSSSSSAVCPPSSSITSRALLHQVQEHAPIFIVGDSHCVTPAWSVLNIHNKPRLLVPKLATGVKQWHLRKDSTFYPKTHFWNMVNTIPRGSEVILAIGEIDCREGILKAVERDYYQTHEDAMLSTIQHSFLPVLKKLLVAPYEFTIYINPVAPVLDVTRPLVIKFNALYRQEMRKLKAQNVHWLDFFDHLLERPVLDNTANQDNLMDIESYLTALNTTGEAVTAVATPPLKQAYRFDGTHLHPAYLQLVEGAINATMQQS